MGQLALAAKITHVPSMYLSEIPGPRFGTRQSAIDGHKEISRRCRAMGVDTLVVFDTHWLVNANYHVNCAPRFKGSYTSNELHPMRDNRKVPAHEIALYAVAVLAVSVIVIFFNP